MLQLDKGLPDGWIVGVDVLCAAHAEARVGRALYDRQAGPRPNLPLWGGQFAEAGGCQECALRRKENADER